MKPEKMPVVPMSEIWYAKKKKGGRNKQKIALAVFSLTTSHDK